MSSRSWSSLRKCATRCGNERLLFDHAVGEVRVSYAPVLRPSPEAWASSGCCRRCHLPPQKLTIPQSGHQHRRRHRRPPVLPGDRRRHQERQYRPQRHDELAGNGRETEAACRLAQPIAPAGWSICSWTSPERWPLAGRTACPSLSGATLFMLLESRESEPSDGQKRQRSGTGVSVPKMRAKRRLLSLRQPSVRRYCAGRHNIPLRPATNIPNVRKCWPA